MPITKTCLKCEVEKGYEEYHRNRQQSDGLQPYCKLCRNAAHSDYYVRNKDQHRNTTLIRKFGITLERYEEMFDEQQGLCALCDQPETSTYKGKQKSLAVDHCHETGRVRGLLCFKCNTALGRVADTPEAAWKLLAYLEGE